MHPDGDEQWRKVEWRKGRSIDELRNKILYEDDQCVIFADVKKAATAHFQCIPKRHIMNYTWLELKQ